MGSRNNKPGRIVKGTAKQPNLKDASGIWSLDEAMQAHRANAWPQPNLFQPVANSLRLKNAGNSALVRQPSRPGNQRTWTWSAWLKLGIVSGTREFFNGSPSGSAFSGIRMIDGQIYIQDYSSGSYNIWWVSSAVYRDTSAWYHIVVKYDTTQAQGNAAILYVNGVQQTLTFNAATGAYVQNRASWINASNTQRFGQNIGGDYYDGQMGEVNFVDGYALQPSLFGKLDSNNTWVPIPYTGSYGTNGFYLPFTNTVTSQTLGYDASVNGTTIYDADQDPYRGSVALHLTGNGPAGGNNNVFADSSTNNLAITRGGTATQGGFSPFPFNTTAPYNPATHGASAYFNGSSDYLSIASVPAIGTQDFTVECWVYANSTAVTGGSNPRVFDVGGAQLVIEDTGKICRLDLNDSTSLYVSNSNVFQLNQWIHIAVVRISNAISFYLNGVAQLATSSSLNLTGGTGYVGVYRGGTVGFWNGYISGLRLTIGKGIYTAAFTPTNRPFGTLTNNLITFSEDFRSYSLAQSSITPSAAIAPDGTPSASKLVEAAGASSHYMDLNARSYTASTAYTYSIYVKAAERNSVMIFFYGDNAVFANKSVHVNLTTGTIAYTGAGITSSIQNVGNGWYRIIATGTAAASATGYIGLYLSTAPGSSDGTVSYTGDGSSGVYVWGAQLETGGTATNYTPTPANYSTAPSLLLNFANAAVVDSAGANNLVTVSNATITSAAKYGSGALTFNGTSDYLNGRYIPPIGTGDFTVETWCRLPNVTPTGCWRAMITLGAYSASGGLSLFAPRESAPANTAVAILNTVNPTIGGTTNINDNQWHHVALVRNRTRLSLYVDGREEGTTSNNDNITQTILYVGADPGCGTGGIGGAGQTYYQGALEDIRITVGVARYTSAFTPPARALPEVGGKSFVTTNINAGVVKTFTTTGTTSWTAPVDVTQVEVLVVAGGGGGANYNSAGGGGAGGLIYNNAYPVIPRQTYTVTVGAGGAGGGTLGDSGSAALGASTSGGNSVFGALIAVGGGNGGQGNVQGSRTADQNPSAGGSGGGARGSSPYNVGGAGTGGQGFAGGNSGTYATNYPGGGGGGAGGAGGNGAGDTTAGNGGVGLQFGISGAPTYYAGGGGGSTQNTGNNSTGGLGGGGAGGSGSGGSFRDGVSGTANTGGGGGAGGFQPQYGVTGLGGNGGSGIVIVRYTTTAVANTSDATTDNLVDSPTLYGHDSGAGGEVVGNYATWNPLIGANYNNSVAIGSSIVVLSNGNLNAYNPALGGSAPKMQCHSNIGMTTGKWYAEFTGLSGRGAGISLGDYILHNGTGSGVSNSLILQPTGGVVNPATGASATVTGTAVAISTTDVVGVAFDVDNRVCYYYRNGVLTQTASNITTTLGTPYFSSGVWYFSSQPESSGSASYITANFGQRAWAYTPPAGYNALTTKNLPRLTNAAAIAPNQYFDAVTYTGTGAAQTITLPGSFQPDLVWVKARANPGTHQNLLHDSVRGITKWLISNDTGVEATDGTSFSSFNSNGFTLGTGANGHNISAETMVAWCWRAGGAPVSNTSGTVTSSVSANTTSGFSIATWTGSNANSATIGHGLTSAPSMFIIKARNATNNWYVWHSGLTGPTYGMSLNAADAQAVFTYGTATVGATTITAVSGANGLANVNATSTNYVGYFWAEVPGFSKIGSYVGNGSTDGPFVYTGFRPAFILTKDITTGSYWWEMVDSARASFNPSDKTLYANVPDSEYTSSGYNKDLISNGFKIRGNSGAHNTVGSTYIYMAFAGKSFGNINGVAR
jgi:hypothetical protein